jgi:L-2-hydroxycarboxylate dehydrogenase (NAD+)
VYAARALPHDMMGLNMSNTDPIVLPAGGTDARPGSNPIAIAVPVAQGPPFIFDAATSVVSAGKFETNLL